MQEHIERTKTQFDADFQTVTSTKELEALKIAFLGKKGHLQKLMEGLRAVPREMKPQMGKYVNDLKVFIESRIAEKATLLAQQEESEKLAGEKIDITLPGRRGPLSSRHPVAAMIDQMVDIFVEMGFSVQSGPEIETDYYNFEGLNFPPDHPARDMQDTIYIEPNILMRTQTTAFQLRVMESAKPPLRVICPGKCYRNESISARSHVFFHQVDVMYVAENVSLQDLSATISTFIQKLFGREMALRFRPSYFPFVEPGVEVDMQCLLCEGKGCPICKHSGWLEILGAGMVHPNVFVNAGLDPEKYTGYAAGIGVERLLMLRHGIHDIRLLFENDMRFLSQFPA
jgi:phenylalanyl-tRNA synthetase alpha chain